MDTGLVRQLENAQKKLASIEKEQTSREARRYMYVCVCVCVCVCIHVLTCLHIEKEQTSREARRYMYVCMCVCVCLYTCTDMLTH
jgi:hypothetical protein